MKTTHLVVVAVLLSTAMTAMAQGPRGRQAGNPANNQASLLDLSKLQTVTGSVTAVHIDYGTQYPSITVNDVAVKLAPVWFLLDDGFQVKTGDQVSALAAPSILPNDSYLYALEITNTTTSASIALRNSAGVPLWTGRSGAQPGPQRRAYPSGRCLDLTATHSVTGVVERLSTGFGIQMPQLVVKTSTGALVTVKIGPERVLLENDVELKVGETLIIKYVHDNCTDENVTLELTNSAGVTLVLRNADGTPHWN